MSPLFFFPRAIRTLTPLLLAAMSAAQDNPVAEKWLAQAPPAPALKVPATQAEWEAQRNEIRATLWKLLGNLPPRPAPPGVTTISREDKGDHWLEKFRFDNGAGDAVPGYCFVPKTAGATNKAPAILYRRWHGGQYDNDTK